ncbi:TPA: CRISPR locus-related DNA-binding protein [Candidatus Bathyarchaeota archaeon]|nr:CRISPR locus-related DNA-binding protein [Candidatus Bathyarchaeota archaeon]
MTKKIVFALGYDTTWLLPKLIDLNVSSGDTLIILVNFEDERAKLAGKSFELLIQNLSVRGMKLEFEFVDVNPKDYGSILSKVLDILFSAIDEELIILLGTGMRIMNLALIQAASLINREIRMEVMLEGTASWIRVDNISLLSCCERVLTGPQKDILKEISRRGIASLAELSSILRKSHSTLSEQLRQLEAIGLVVRTSKKPAKYALSPAGRAVLWSTT